MTRVVPALLLLSCARELIRLESGGVSSNAASVQHAAFINRTDAIVVSWIGFSSSEGIARYDVGVSGSPTCDVVVPQQTQETQLELTGLSLAHGARYFACVRAISTINSMSPWIASAGFAVDTTPPPPPAALNATAGINQVALAWSAVGDAHSGLSGYEIGRCQGACSDPEPLYRNILTNAFTSIDGQNCVDYTFYVRAVDRAGNVSPYSPAAIARANTERPSSVVAVAGFGVVEVAFAPVTGAEDYVVCYSDVPDACANHRHATGGRAAVRVAGVPAATTTVAVRAVRNGCESESSPDVGVVMARPEARGAFAVPSDVRFGAQIARRFSYSDYSIPYQVSAPDTSSGGEIFGCALAPFTCTSELASPSPNARYGGRMRHVDLYGYDFAGQKGVNVIGYVNGFHVASGSQTLTGDTFDSMNGTPHVAALDDRNGDGVPELLIGLGRVGEARVHNGQDGDYIGGVTGASGFAETVDSAGDLNGDGIGELLVMSTRVSGTSTLHVFSGATGFTELDAVTGLQPEANVRHVGDVDGDGVGDFAVGTPRVDEDQGRVTVYSGRTRAVLREHVGSQPLGWFGAMIQPAGDVDGDGYGDVLIGSPTRTDTSMTPFGELSLYSGATGALLFTLASGTLEDEFGASAMIGDANRDGILELLVGAPMGNTVYAYAIPQPLAIIGGDSVDPEDPTTERGFVLLQHAPSGKQLYARGGAPPYRWSLITNRTGATLSSAGFLEPGPDTRVLYDVVRVTDARGRSVDARVRSENTPEPTTFLRRPASVAATRSLDVNITWTPVAGAIGYVVESRTPTRPWTTLPVTTALSATIAAPPAHAQLLVRVKAQDETNDSAWSPLVVID